MGGLSRSASASTELPSPAEADVPMNPPSSLDFDVVSWPELEAFVGPGGALESAMPGYERRIGQELMMRAVATAIERRETLLVEAGTGTGKSLAYLLPAVLSGEQVIVSTGTKTLQDQLAKHQLPFVRDALHIDFEWAVLKGRTNYLCLHRLEQSSRDPSMALDLAEDFGRVVRWSERTDTGDRAELADLSDASPVWRSVTTDREQCLGKRCAFYEDCFVMRARRRADAADIIVVNHHLLFADLVLRDDAGFGLLPDATVVVLDEAHHLEDVAASSFGVAISDQRVTRLTRDVRRLFAQAALSLGDVGPAADRVEQQGRALFEALRPLLPKTRLSHAVIPDAVRANVALIDLSLGVLATTLLAVSRTDESIVRLAERCTALRHDVLELLTADDEPTPEIERTEVADDPSDEAALALPVEPDVPWVRWVEAGPRALFVRAAPIDVGPSLDDRLFRRFRTVVLTSATLSTDDTFDHIRSRLGLPRHALELSVASPFNYPRQALLYTPSDMPRPSSHDAYDALAERMGQLVELTGGRALLLFTSFRALDAVHERLAHRLPYLTLRQGDGARDALLARFRANPTSVLFGTGTFWEGVDVVGDALSLVAIDKLPFAPPGEPLHDARIAALRRSGINPFMGYQVPSAVITLKQGVGRLIRHRDDRGIIAVLDPRLIQSRYGRAFLTALPAARRTLSFQQLSHWWTTMGDGEDVPLQFDEDELPF